MFFLSVTNSMEQGSSREADSQSLSQESNFITVFTRARHWTVSRDRWIQSTSSHPISLRSIQILSFHLLPGSSEWSLPLRFSNKNTVRISHISHACYMSCPYSTTLFVILTIFCEVYKLWSSSLCSLLQSRAVSSHLGPNILNNLFSNTPNLCSCQ
jgi:hypothetical protein